MPRVPNGDRFGRGTPLVMRAGAAGSAAVSRLLLPWLVMAGCQSKPTLDAAQPSQRCATCHLAEFQAVSKPPHPGVRPTTCAVCHLPTSWHPFTLRHAWPLEGAHAKANCFDCHRGQPRQFEGTSKACFACHEKEDTAADTRVEHHSLFGKQCETCHSASAWKPILPNAVFPPDVNEASNPLPSEAVGGQKPASQKKLTKAPPTSTSRATPTLPSPALKKPDTISGASRHTR